MKSQREDVSFDEIAERFNMPIMEAASHLGVPTATLKRLCRENGLKRWPYRKVMAGRSIEEIKQEAAWRLAHGDASAPLMSPVGSAVATEWAEGASGGAAADGDTAPMPLRGTRSRSGLIVRLGMNRSANKDDTDGAALPGKKRSALGAPKHLAADHTPPILQSIRAQSPLHPPSFPFPYPVPMSKRHLSEARWNLPSHQLLLRKGFSASALSRTTDDLWGPKAGRGASQQAAKNQASVDAMGSQGAPSRPEDQGKTAAGTLPAPHWATLLRPQIQQRALMQSSGRNTEASPLPDCGFDASAFDAVRALRKMHEKRAERISVGLRSCCSRGYVLPGNDIDVGVLNFVFGEYMPSQWHSDAQPHHTPS